MAATSFPELLRFRGLLSDVPQMRGLLAPPTAPPQPQGPPPMAPPPPQQGGGLRDVLGMIFGGADDPNLTPEQNQQARRQALIQAGLGILASERSGLGAVAEGGLYGQQAGGQARQAIYGRTQQERVAQALTDPNIVGKLSPQQLSFIRMMEPKAALEAISKIVFAEPDKPTVVGNYAIGPSGEVIFKAPEKVDLPADFDVALKSIGVDPAKATTEDVQRAIPVYERLKKAGSTNINVGEQQAFAQQNALAGQFRQDIGEYQTIASAYANVNTSASNPSPAGDISLVFAYMKMVDPGSTVREGEQAQVRNAANIPERLRAQYNRMLGGGESLTPAQRADFVGRAAALARQKQKQLEPVLNRYKQRAATVGMDPSLIVFDPFAEAGLAPVGGAFGDLVPKK